MKEEKGFTLLVAIVVTSFLLIVSFSIGNIALKQLTLSYANQESQYSYYNAESGIECAAYWDLMNSTTTGISLFDPLSNQTINCNGGNVAVTGNGVSTSTFTVNLTKGCVNVEVGKYPTITVIQAYGYNTCAAGALRKFERGVFLSYDSSGSSSDSPSGPPAFVQANTASTVGPHQIALSNVASGNSILVGVAQPSSAARTYTVSDSRGNSYVSLGLSTASGRITQVFLAQGVTGDPSLVVTVNQSGSAVGLNIVALEVSGVTSVDTSGSSTDLVAVNNHACSTPGLNTTTDVFLFCAGTLNSSGTTLTAAGGYTRIGAYTNTMFQYKTSASALVGETATWNSTTARLSAEVFVSLK